MKGRRHLTRNIAVWLKGVAVAALVASASAPTALAEGGGSFDGIVPPAGLPALPPGFGGIGPVVSGSVEYSAIPKKARRFLERHCNGQAVTRCEKEFASGNFLLSLGDGIDMTFNPKGELVAISAPDHYSLSPWLLKAVVPGKLFKLLDAKGFKSAVEAVKHSAEGYSMEVADPVFNHLNYSPKGEFTMSVNP